MKFSTDHSRSRPNEQLSPRRDIVQLSIWPEPVRGGPNALLRSALFAGIASKKRKVLGTQVSPVKAPEGVEIIAQAGSRIKYAGAAKPV
ncbi:hypothetical protein [Acidisarcina polymorpha]|uniref:hypothetical protein n=1 Tax=Acidisarcina polymorpha TaxID=2211140 RepID=UPI000DEFFDC2|nr:hypothetical protein [Acidisarcina polymorpha]